MFIQFQTVLIPIQFTFIFHFPGDRIIFLTSLVDIFLWPGKATVPVKIQLLIHLSPTTLPVCCQKLCSTSAKAQNRKQNAIFLAITFEVSNGVISN